MEKKILYHIGLYGFRKLIVYVIKDNGDNISIVSLNKDGSFPNTFGTVICIKTNNTNIPPRRAVSRHSFKL